MLSMTLYSPLVFSFGISLSRINGDGISPIGAITDFSTNIIGFCVVVVVVVVVVVATVGGYPFVFKYKK